MTWFTLSNKAYSDYWESSELSTEFGAGRDRESAALSERDTLPAFHTHTCQSDTIRIIIS